MKVTNASSSTPKTSSENMEYNIYLFPSECWLECRRLVLILLPDCRSAVWENYYKYTTLIDTLSHSLQFLHAIFTYYFTIHVWVWIAVRLRFSLSIPVMFRKHFDYFNKSKYTKWSKWTIQWQTFIGWAFSPFSDWSKSVYVSRWFPEMSAIFDRSKCTWPWGRFHVFLLSCIRK